MALEKMNRCGPPLSAEDIAHIEATLGVKLWPAHKKFLLKYNGGEPVPCYIHRRVADMEAIKVDTIYGLGGSFDILLANSYNGDLCPKGTIVFAGDDLGSSFLIGVSGRYKGQILFLDVEANNPKPYLVARSWSSFLDKLRPDLPPIDPKHSYFSRRK